VLAALTGFLPILGLAAWWLGKLFGRQAEITDVQAKQE